MFLIGHVTNLEAKTQLNYKIQSSELMIYSHGNKMKTKLKMVSFSIHCIGILLKIRISKIDFKLLVIFDESAIYTQYSQGS